MLGADKLILPIFFWPKPAKFTSAATMNASLVFSIWPGSYAPFAMRAIYCSGGSEESGILSNALV